MALEKIEVVDRIEIIENGCIQVRTKIAIMENGQQISSTFHRHVLAPGDEYSAQDAKVKSICATIHTESVVAEYRASLERD
jgi:hypothetical protein